MTSGHEAAAEAVAAADVAAVVVARGQEEAAGRERAEVEHVLAEVVRARGVVVRVPVAVREVRRHAHRPCLVHAPVPP